MLKKTKLWVITASLLIVLGAALFTAAMTAYDWDFSMLSTRTYVSQSHEVSESFTNLTAYSDTADIRILPSEDGVCRVTCFDHDHVAYEVRVQDGTLEIIPQYKKQSWIPFIDFSFEIPQITIMLPEAEYGALKLETDTGDVTVPNGMRFASVEVTTSTGNVSLLASVLGSVKLQATTGDLLVEGVAPTSLELSTTTGRITVKGVTATGEASVKVSTGDARLTDMTCKSLTTIGSTGDITLKNVIAEQALSIERSTGDVILERCDAAEILVKTDTGDVKGTLRSSKIFFHKTDTGRVRLPQTTEGGRCEIITDTGDIHIEIQ